MSAINPFEITEIGPYAGVEYIAEGGMAWVFRVRDPRLFNAVRALKLLKPQAAQGEEFKRFEREAEMLAQIQHPHLLHVYDFGQDDKTHLYYYTMDFIEGQSLADVHPDWLQDQEATVLTSHDPEATVVGMATAEEKGVTLERACNYFVGVLSALERLHRQGIIHRDVKPSNIFITREGNAILGDLGIAKGHEGSGVTRAGFTPGTPLYMSPEHSLGDASDRSDLFSVGLTMYRVLTGKTVYDSTEGVDSTNSNEVLRYLWNLHGQKSDFVFFFPPQIPEPLAEVIRRACRLEPGDRYASAAEMREALQDAMLRLRDRRPDAREAGIGLDWGAILGRVGRVAAALVAVAVLGVVGWAGYQFLVGSGQTAEGLRDETVRYGEQATALVDWIEGLKKAPAELIREARAGLRRAQERVEDGKADLAVGEDGSASRMFNRAQTGYIQVCDRLSDQFLVAAAAEQETRARGARARVPAEAERHVQAEWQALIQAEQAMQRAIAPAGCERAIGLREQIGAAEQVVAQSAVVGDALDAAWPAIVDGAIGDATAAMEIAHAAEVSFPVYRSEMAAGNRQLTSARRSLERKKYDEAYDQAREARQVFETAAAIGPAWQARKDANEAVARAESKELAIGALRTQHLEGQRLYEAGEWAQSREVLLAVRDDVERLLVASGPANTARDGASEARRRAIKAGVPDEALQDADARREDALRKLHARQFRSAEEAFNDAAAVYSASIDEWMESLDAQRESAQVAKAEEERQRLREELERLQADRDQALAAQEHQERTESEEREKLQQEVARLEAEREKARRDAEAEREQLAALQQRKVTGGESDLARQERERLQQEVARLEQEREKAHQDAERERKRLEDLRRQKAQELERQKQEQAERDRELADLKKEEAAQAQQAQQAPAPEGDLVAAVPPEVSVAPRRPKPSTLDEAVRQVMDEYEAAYESRSIDRLNRVWTMSTYERVLLSSDMRKCDEMKMSLDIANVSVSGNKARVDFDQVTRNHCGGKRKDSISELAADLVLRGGKEWQIVKISTR